MAALLLATACARGGASPAAGGGREGGAGRGGAAAVVPVTVGTVVQKPMAVKVRAVGNVEASSTVEVRSQVTGELQQVAFTEGQDVTAGQLLFLIDPRSFEAAVQQAQATLTRDTAQAKNIEAQRARLANLLQRGLVPQSDYDTIATSAATSQAAMAADQAALESAKLQLDRTRIVAPVSGRTGALLAHQGSIVRTTDGSPLVVINQIAPAYVSFAVPARLLPQIRRGLSSLVAEAMAADSADAPSSGHVTFVDNAVDPATDTIRLKATFPNVDHRLWPGAFVDITLRLSVDSNALVVPTIAVQPGQQGSFVYLVKADQTVEARPVTIAWVDGDDSVVTSGLAAGDTVVTDGQLRLAPGARISVKPADAAKRP
jgi:multidrug efflux system membrane fusion protein